MDTTDKRRAIEVVAEAWASIDGKTDRFNMCRDNEVADSADGTYSGYIQEATDLIQRIERRGFKVIPLVSV